MGFFTTAMIVGGVTGGLAVLLLAFLAPHKFCPKCSTALPRFRRPSSVREAALGGWSCPSCKANIARNGSTDGLEGSRPSNN